MTDPTLIHDEPTLIHDGGPMPMHPPVSPRQLLELSEAVDDAKVSLANAVGAPSVGPDGEVAAAERLSTAELEYTSAAAFGAFAAPARQSAMLGLPAHPQAAETASAAVSASEPRDPEPMKTEDDLEPIAPIDPSQVPTPPKRRGRPPKAKVAVVDPTTQTAEEIGQTADEIATGPGEQRPPKAQNGAPVVHPGTTETP